MFLRLGILRIPLLILSPPPSPFSNMGAANRTLPSLRPGLANSPADEYWGQVSLLALWLCYAPHAVPLLDLLLALLAFASPTALPALRDKSDSL